MNAEQESNRTVTQVLSAWMQDAFRRAFPDAEVGFEDVGVVATANPEFGDYQCNAAMPLAKVLKRSPREIAQRAVEAAAEHAAIAKTEIAGPGFVNLFVAEEWLAARLERMLADASVSLPPVGAGKTVVLDYSSPNVAKPMHIGHIRSTIIGNALDRLHRALAYNVVSDNHVGDWGTQFGIIINGYRHFARPEVLETAPVEELERVYVLSYEKSKEDEEWLARCRQELVKLQAGDPENTRLWKEFVRLSMAEFDHIYGRLGVRFDLVRGESHYNDRLEGVVERLENEGLAVESEGALVVRLEEEGLPLCIVRKSDGGYNYTTTDLATVSSRVDEFAPDRIVYVTDERQQLHFRQFFAVSRSLGCATDLVHVWFGLMRLPDGVFSTRQGNVIKLEHLLDEAESRALAIIRESSPDMPEEQQREVARAVGIGAVKYADLSQNPQTAVTFTWEKAMALDGNSGPYLQYACARIASVRGKHSERFPDRDPDGFPLAFSDPLERTLALKLIRFPDVVVQATHAYRPSQLADYLYDLAQTYSSFYQNVPFLKAPDGVRESRVRLCGFVAAVLRCGLDLLGIETPERI